MCQVSVHADDGDSLTTVSRVLHVKSDATWDLKIHGHSIPHHILADFPVHLDHESTSLLLTRLSTLNTCPGNPEPKFTSLKDSGKFLSATNQTVAYLDSNYLVTVKEGTKENSYTSTVRTTNCHLLTKDVRCTACKKYRKNLLAQYSRVMRMRTTNRSKKVNYR